MANLTQRIRHAWSVVDAALALRSNAQQPIEREESVETEDGSDSQTQTTNGLRCPSCGVELSAIAGEPAAPAAGGEGAGGDGGGGRGLGLRVEEVRKGLAVTHVVPDGLADAAGFMVGFHPAPPPRCAAVGVQRLDCAAQAGASTRRHRSAR